MTDVQIPVVTPAAVLPPVPETCVCARQQEDCTGKPAGANGLCKHCLDASCGLYRVEAGTGPDVVLHVDFSAGAPVTGRYRPLTGALAG